jgi:WD40 repeat protein/predicted Ser/Thr protein kinase
MSSPPSPLHRDAPVFVNCPACLTQLNIPSDAVRITCSKCRCRFDMRPDGTHLVSPAQDIVTQPTLGPQSSQAPTLDASDSASTDADTVTPDSLNAADMPPSDILFGATADTILSAGPTKPTISPLSEEQTVLTHGLPDNVSATARTLLTRREPPGADTFDRGGPIDMTGAPTIISAPVPSRRTPGKAKKRKRAATPDSEAMRLLQNSLTGRYTITGFISHGGMGAVYRAEQQSPRRDVALKVMLTGPFAAEKFRERFRREAEAAGRLNHPGIVPVYESGEVGGQLFFTMEFVEGVGLRKYCRTNELGNDEMCRMMIRICDAIHYAHRFGIIHRDLKPANILVDQTGRPRVLDFGLSRIDDPDNPDAPALTQSVDFLGTPRYMAPEQALKSAHHVDARSDVYALGAMLFELIVGVLPYPIENKKGLAFLETLRSAPPLDPRLLHADMPRDLAIILLKACEKDPARRYQTAEAFAQDLEALLAGRTISARPATFGYKLDRWLWRHRHMILPALASVAVIAVLTGLLVISLMGRSGDRQALTNVQQGLQDAAKGAASGRDAIQKYISEGKWRLAHSLAENATVFWPNESGLDELPGRVRRAVERRLRRDLEDFSALLKQTSPTQALAKAQALTALAAELPYLDLSTQAAAPGSTFTELHWKSLAEACNISCSHQETIDRISAFVTHASTVDGTPHLREAEELKSHIAGLTSADYVRRHEAAFARACTVADWHTADEIVESATDLAGDDLPEGWTDIVSSWRSRMATVIRPETAEHLTVQTALARTEGSSADVLFSADGRLLLTRSLSTQTASAWSVTDGALLMRLAGSTTVNRIAVSPADGTLALAYDDGSGLLAGLAADKITEIRRFKKQRTRASALSFSPDGTVLLAADMTGVVMWEVATGRALDASSVAGHAPVAFSRDGQSLATTLGAEGVRVWRRGDAPGRWSREMDLPGTGRTSRLAFSPDGRMLASLPLGDAQVLSLWDTVDGQLVRSFRVSETTGNKSVRTMSFSADGSMIVTGGTDKTVRLWEVATGRKLWEHQDEGIVLSAAFSPTGTALAVGRLHPKTRIWGLGVLVDEDEEDKDRNKGD